MWRRLRSWFFTITLISGSILFTLVVLEVGLRLFAPQPLNLYNFALINEKGMVVKGSGPRPGIIYRVERKPPGMGPMIPSKRLRMGNVDVEVNEHGWRDRVYPRQAALGTYRLTVVGDSVTLGYGVALEETYHKRLEDRLNQAGGAVGKRFEVLALAGGGGTSYDALRMVRRHISYFQPNEIWLALNLNDILHNPYSDALRQTAGNGDSPSLRVHIMMGLGWLREKSDALLRPYSHLYHLVRQRAKVVLRLLGIYSPTMQPEAAFAFSSADAQAAWSATLAAIVEMRTEALRHDARFAVVVLPADPQVSSEIALLYRHQFYFRFDDDFAEAVVQQRICQDLAAQDIECQDPLPLFRAHADQQLFLRIHGDSVDWNHPNTAGHALLAEALFAALQPRLLPDQTRTDNAATDTNTISVAAQH